MIEFLTQYFSQIILVFGGLGAWFNERSKRKSEYKKLQNEVRSQEISAEKEIVKMYQDALDDLKKWNDARFKEVDTEIEALRKNLDLWKGKYRNLKKEFDDYKIKHQNNV